MDLSVACGSTDVSLQKSNHIIYFGEKCPELKIIFAPNDTFHMSILGWFHEQTKKYRTIRILSFQHFSSSDSTAFLRIEFSGPTMDWIKKKTTF